MTGRILKLKLAPLGITQAELAERLGVSESTVYRIFTSPDVRTADVERISRATGKSITFLYDVTDQTKAFAAYHPNAKVQAAPSPRPGPKQEPCNLEERVRALLKEQHKTTSGLAQYVGISETHIQRIFARNSCSLATLRKIADYFKVPVSHFFPADRHATEIAKKDLEIMYLWGQLKGYRKALAVLTFHLLPTETQKNF